MNKPYKIGVHSDNYEYHDAAATAPEGTLDNNRGFSISKFSLLKADSTIYLGRLLSEDILFNKA